MSNFLWFASVVVFWDIMLTCERKMNDATTSTLKEKQHGEWLRVNNIRTIRRIIKEMEGDVQRTLEKEINENNSGVREEDLGKEALGKKN